MLVSRELENHVQGAECTNKIPNGHSPLQPHAGHVLHLSALIKHSVSVYLDDFHVFTISLYYFRTTCLISKAAAQLKTRLFSNRS